MKSHIDDNKKKRIKETAYGIWYVISCIVLALLVALYVGVLVRAIREGTSRKQWYFSTTTDMNSPVSPHSF